MKSLFESGNFKLHSGDETWWRINLEFLKNESLETIAKWAYHHVVKFKAVEGVPTGGERLAKFLEPYVAPDELIDYPLLIVDDVLTTGESMELHRANRYAIGFVVFARGVCPNWITAMWQLKEG